MTEVQGSVRVDLLGGTLDLDPINTILSNVVTLNVATSLKAQIQIESADEKGITLISEDYQSEFHFAPEDFTGEKLRSGFFKEMTFMALILDHFKQHSGLRIRMRSGSPAGAGLGGSSAMGVTFFSALSQFLGKELERENAIRIVKSLEAQVLDSGPTGYQDYYPALFGGILALAPREGRIAIEQLYSDELKSVLENNVTLIFSGEKRFSGINNWEVYKAFFDKDEKTRKGLGDIADLSHEALMAIKQGSFEKLPKLMGEEGLKRDSLFPGIVTDSMSNLFKNVSSKVPGLGMKVCGAGGGGCFLLTHGPEHSQIIEEAITAANMEKLPFVIEKPLG